MSDRVAPPRPAFACLYAPAPAAFRTPTATVLLEIAQAFSPRYEHAPCECDGSGADREPRFHTVVVDVSGLERLMRPRAVRSPLVERQRRGLPTATALRTLRHGVRLARSSCVRLEKNSCVCMLP